MIPSLFQSSGSSTTVAHQQPQDSTSSDTRICTFCNSPNMSSSSSSPQPLQLTNSSSHQEPPMKKTNYNLSNYFLADMNVNQILQQSSMGRGILEQYSIRKRLDNKVRSDLVKLIIDAVMNRYYTMTSKFAEVLAEDIIKVFPSEAKATFYYSAMSNKKNSGGKLLDRYRNIKKRYSFPKPQGATATNTDPNEELLFKVNWLRSSDEPWHLVEEYWRDTFEERNKDRIQPGPASEFVSKWPSLKHNLGFSLVCLILTSYLCIIVIDI